MGVVSMTMSDDDNFLARWSRRKHLATKDATEASKQQDALGNDTSNSAGSTSPGEAPPPLEAMNLPAIESIDAGSNIQAFLDARVPLDLTRAALRRAWSADPAIRDFVGLSENSWDFNAQGAMPGFGPINKEEVGRLLTQLLGDPETPSATVHKAPAGPLISPSTDHSERSTTESDAGQHQATNSQVLLAPATDQEELDLKQVSKSDGRTSYGRAATSRQQPAPRNELSTTPRRSHGRALPRSDN